MLQMILKKLITKFFKPHKRVYVEDIFYSKEVYPIYLCVQHTFKFCLQNHLLKRKDILYFKEMINKCIIDQYPYKDIKFQNDCHEIYKKLKSHDITSKQMKRLLNFISQFVMDIPDPKQTVQYLKVIK